MIKPEDSTTKPAPSSEVPAGYRLCTLNLDDAQRGLRLSRQAGWNQTVQDWEMILRIGWCTGLMYDDALVATTATLHWGNIAWIAMVLVDRDHRRQGLGTCLLQQHIETADRERRIAALDASEQGLPLYLRHGFREVCRLTRYTAEHLPVPALRAIESGGTETIAAVDEKHTRLGCRGRLFREFSSRGLSMTQDSDFGFAYLRPGDFASQVGPLIASGTSGAMRLLELVSACRGQSGLLIDVPDFQSDFRRAVEAAGFLPGRSFVRMLRANNPGEICPSNNTFAVAGPELG